MADMVGIDILISAKAILEREEGDPREVLMHIIDTLSQSWITL